MRYDVAVSLLWIGVALELLALLGVCVMRDAFDRLHCVSLAGYGALVIAVSISSRYRGPPSSTPTTMLRNRLIVPPTGAPHV